MVVSEELAGAAPRSATSVAAPRFTEPLLVWALHGIFRVLILVTYSRVAPEELYHVSRGGLAGGAGRVLVELNYPVALAALPILGLCAARLRRRAVPAAGVAIAGALTVWALREGGVGQGPRRLAGDPLRIVVASLSALVSIP